LFAEIDRAQLDARKLEAQRERLELEKRELATPKRVEKLAKDKLQMRMATPAITHYVNYAASRGEATDLGPRPAAGGRVQ
jgi:cell division protein FtsL